MKSNIILLQISLGKKLHFQKCCPCHFFQSLHFPQESVIGCIRNIKFNDVLIGEPAVNHGGTPCFDGVVEKGTYFAGDGSHIILG